MAGCISIVHFSLGILLFLFMKITPAEASLYPTKPIANTTYIAGQAALVTWAEDGTKPLLDSMGKMKIDLYAGKNTFLATVAKDIDPRALSTTIFIPSAIPAHYYLFNLRFKAASTATPSSVPLRPLARPRLRIPSIAIYTADFSITPNPLSIQSAFPLRTSNLAKATHTSHSTTSSLFSASTLTHPNITPTLILTPVSKSTSSSTAVKPGKKTSGAAERRLRSRGVMQAAGMMWMVKMFMGLDGPHGWDSGEMKFQLAFIFWPMLIGLSMTM